MLFVFAVLPLGLLAWWDKTLRRSRPETTCAWAFLIPLAISAASMLAEHFKGKSDAKKAQKAADEQAAAQAAAEKQKFEQEQTAPETQMQQLQYKIKLGKLAGKMGGLNKVPPSILNALKAGYAQKQYQPTPTYTPKIQGPSGWDLAEEGIGAAGQALNNASADYASKSLGGSTGGGDYGASQAVAAGGGLSKGFSAGGATGSVLNSLLASKRKPLGQ